MKKDYYGYYGRKECFGFLIKDIKRDKINRKKDPTTSINLVGWEWVKANLGDEIYGSDNEGYLYTLKKLDQDLNN